MAHPADKMNGKTNKDKNNTTNNEELYDASEPNSPVVDAPVVDTEQDPEEAAALAAALALSMQPQSSLSSAEAQTPSANNAADAPKAEAPKTAEASKSQEPKKETTPKAAEASKAEATNAAAAVPKEKEEKSKAEVQFTLTPEHIEVLKDIPRSSLRHWWTTAGYVEFKAAMLEYSLWKAEQIIPVNEKTLGLKKNMERDHSIFTLIDNLIKASKESNVSIDTIIKQLPASDPKKMKDFEGKIKFWLRFYQTDQAEIQEKALAASAAASKQSGKVPPLKLGGLGDDPDLSHDKPKPQSKGQGMGFGTLGGASDFERAIRMSLAEQRGGASQAKDADMERAIALSMGKPDPAAQSKPMGSAEYKAGQEAQAQAVAAADAKRRQDKPKSNEPGATADSGPEKPKSAVAAGATVDSGPVKPQAQKPQAQKGGQNAGNPGSANKPKPAPSMIVPLTTEEQIKDQQGKVARLEKSIAREEATFKTQQELFKKLKAENEKALKELFDTYEKRNAQARENLEKLGMDQKILKEIEAGTIFEAIASFSDKKQALIQKHIEAILKYQQYVEEYNAAKRMVEKEQKPKMAKTEQNFVQKGLEIERSKIELREAKDRLKYLESKKKQEDAEMAALSKLGASVQAPKADNKPAQGAQPAQGEPAQGEQAQAAQATQAAAKPEAVKAPEQASLQTETTTVAAKPQVQAEQPGATTDAAKAQTPAEKPGATTDATKAQAPAAATSASNDTANKPAPFFSVQRSQAQQLLDLGSVNIDALHRKERDEQRERMKALQRQQAPSAEQQASEQVPGDKKAGREAAVSRLEQLARGGSSNRVPDTLAAFTSYTTYSNLGANAAQVAPAAPVAQNDTAPALASATDLARAVQAPVQEVVQARPAEEDRSKDSKEAAKAGQKP